MHLRSGDTLKALAKQGGHSYQDVAARAGCHKSFIGALAVEAKTRCSDELAQRIAEVLDVPVDILFAPTASGVTGRNVRQSRSAA